MPKSHGIDLPFSGETPCSSSLIRHVSSPMQIRCAQKREEAGGTFYPSAYLPASGWIACIWRGSWEKTSVPWGAGLCCLILPPHSPSDYIGGVTNTSPLIHTSACLHFFIDLSSKYLPLAACQGRGSSGHFKALVFHVGGLRWRYKDTCEQGRNCSAFFNER